MVVTPQTFLEKELRKKGSRPHVKGPKRKRKSALLLPRITKRKEQRPSAERMTNGAKAWKGACERNPLRSSPPFTERKTTDLGGLLRTGEASRLQVEFRKPAGFKIWPFF